MENKYDKLSLTNLELVKYKMDKSVELNESLLENFEFLDLYKYISERIEMIKEDEGGTAGIAYATAGNVAGMGNVVAAQPASVSGALVTGDGTVGSGDVGVPFGLYGKMPAYGFGEKSKGKKGKGKKSNVKNDIANFLSKHKKGKFGNTLDGGDGTKVMNFNDFVKNDITKVKKAK